MWKKVIGHKKGELDVYSSSGHRRRIEFSRWHGDDGDHRYRSGKPTEGDRSEWGAGRVTRWQHYRNGSRRGVTPTN